MMPLRMEVRKNFFIQRVTTQWNLLPVDAKPLCIFKTEIDRFLIKQGMKGHGEKAGDWGEKEMDQP